MQFLPAHPLQQRLAGTSFSCLLMPGWHRLTSMIMQGPAHLPAIRWSLIKGAFSPYMEEPWRAVFFRLSLWTISNSEILTTFNNFTTLCIEWAPHRFRVADASQVSLIRRLVKTRLINSRNATFSRRRRFSFRGRKSEADAIKTRCWVLPFCATLFLEF
jgi:hypothetical protein